MTTRQYGRTIPKTYIYNRKKYELLDIIQPNHKH